VSTATAGDAEASNRRHRAILRLNLGALPQHARLM
jgi:hypothetical protein